MLVQYYHKSKYDFDGTTIQQKDVAVYNNSLSLTYCLNIRDQVNVLLTQLSMYRVVAICIIHTQNGVKIEVFGTFIFLCLRPYETCLQTQPHSIYQNNPPVISYPLIVDL